MTIEELQRFKEYRDNLLIFIHNYTNYIGLKNHTYKKLASLIKEHKRVTQFINEIEKK